MLPVSLMGVSQTLKSKSVTSTTTVVTNKGAEQPTQQPLQNRGTQSSGKYGPNLKTEASPAITGTYKQVVRTSDNKQIEVLYKVDTKTRDAATVSKTNQEKRMNRQSINKKTGGDDNWNCSSENIKVNINDDSYMRVAVLAQAANLYPGLIYKFENYVNGQWKSESENRTPFVISTSVENINGSPQETVLQPDLGGIRSAVSTLYSKFTRKPDEIATGALKVHVEEITSSAELDIKVGASGYGGGFSASNNFHLNKKSNSRIFLFDCIKEMFTVDATQPSGGFFSNPNQATADMMYISTVTYGLRILAMVQFEIDEEKIKNNFKASYDALTAGGMASVDVARDITQNRATISMFVIGGQSNESYVEYSIEAMKKRIQEIQRTLTYNNSRPIQYQFRNMDNRVVKYSSATDWFPVTNCEPKSESEKPATFVANIQFISLVDPMEDDVDLYGTIRAELVDAAGNKLPSKYGNTYLLNLKNNEYIKSESLKSYSSQLPVNEISFDVGAEQVSGAKLLIHYWLMDEDDSGDDPIKMRGKDADYLVNGNKHYVQTIWLDELKKGSSIQPVVGFADEDGDYPFTITINVQKK